MRVGADRLLDIVVDTVGVARALCTRPFGLTSRTKKITPNQAAEPQNARFHPGRQPLRTLY